MAAAPPNRLAARLAERRAAGRKVLATFITAGDPSNAATVPAMQALTAGGADVVELGVPFSDPEADGPAIQASSERALAQGTTLAQVLTLAAEFRATDAATPVVLMGYLNQFLRMGYATFCQRAAAAGVDGAIVVNMPPEEAADFRAEARRHGLDLVFLLAPTTPPARAAAIAARASGFLYYVSFKGVTGAAGLDADAIGARLAALRPHTGRLPILVGFGIRSGAAAARVAVHADGVVVGSALVETMSAAGEFAPRLTAQVREIRAALDGLPPSSA